jgi:hypothetical protein
LKSRTREGRKTGLQSQKKIVVWAVYNIRRRRLAKRLVNAILNVIEPEGGAVDRSQDKDAGEVHKQTVQVKSGQDHDQSKETKPKPKPKPKTKPEARPPGNPKVDQSQPSSEVKHEQEHVAVHKGNQQNNGLAQVITQ